MFKLSEFITEVESRGVMRTNTFLVNFGLPVALRQPSETKSASLEMMTLRCDSVQLPGMGFATIDGPPSLGYGPIEAIPYGAVFDDITCTFLVDARGDIHKFFYNWMNAIVNFNAQGQTKLKDSTGPITGMKPYEVNFKDDITTTINIEVYDTGTGVSNDPSNKSTRTGQKVMTARAYKAFPKILPSLDLSWGTTDEVVRLSIPFNYTDFNIEYHNRPTL